MDLSFHPSVFPNVWRARLLAALRGENGTRRHLPGQFLYQSPAQARRWLDYHQAWAPSRKDEALRGFYRRAYGAALAAAGAGGGLRYVSLGCGGGRKDGAFLEECLKARLADALAAWSSAPTAGAPGIAYLPVDASAALVLEAVLHVRERLAGLPAGAGAAAPLACHPLVADLEAEPDLGPWLASARPAEGGSAQAAPGEGPATVITCFGLLPNLDPAAFPAYLARMTPPGAALLVSANLSPGGLGADRGWILPQYDNPPARAWYGGALAELGFPPDGVALRVVARPLTEGDESAWRIVVEAEVRRAFTLALFDEEIPFRPGETLEVFVSHRFTATAAERVLAAAGLAVADRWLMASAEEGIWLCLAPPAA